MAQAKRRKRRKAVKLKILPRALIRKLAREWAEQFRERLDDFIPPKKAPKKAPKLPTLIPLTKREAGERNEQRRLASVEFQRVRYLVARDEERRALAELERMKTGRGMTADELQDLYRSGTPPEIYEPLRHKQLNLNREFDQYATTVRELADKHNLDVAIDTARFYGVHPGEWAVDMAYDFDLDQSDIYEEFFYPAEGAAAW